MSANMIDAIGFLAPTDEVQPKAANSIVSDFSAWFDKELNHVNTQLLNSDTELRRLVAGETDNLHQVMISMEEAKLSFQLALQVRNRVLEAYQDILRMQV